MGIRPRGRALNIEAIASSERPEKLKDLKRRIAMHEYEVDSRRVADAIVGKLRLINSARFALDAMRADRNQTQFEPRRPDR
jgi:hypothetical protein